jgi:hypothetical protein
MDFLLSRAKIAFLTMKADDSADCEVLCLAWQGTGLCLFFFFWDFDKITWILKKTDCRWGLI